MRIGLFTDTYLPDINGVVSSTVTLKKALEKQGHTVYVITNHAGSKIELKDRVLRLPGVPLKGLYGYKLSSPISLGAGTYIHNMNLDVIHLQTNFGIGIYGQTLAKSLGIPLVDTYHTMYEDYTHYINPRGWNGIEKVSKEMIRAASRQVCNDVQAVVSPSQKTKEILQDYGVIAPIYVVPTGLDLSAFTEASLHQEKCAEIRKRVTDDPDAVILVFVGRLAKEKSLEIPIETFARLDNPHFHLAVVGAGPDEDYYKDLTTKLKANDKVHFLGKADPEEIADYYAAFDAFVSASLSETQGMTYLEALATGLTVFGRRDEVLDGLIDEGQTGYYFDTSEELAKKLETFSKMSKEERKGNMEKCRAKTSDYTDTMFAAKMQAVYNQAILDYSQTYIVDKIKIGDDFVGLTLSRDSEREPVSVLIPLEDYFELKISMGTKLDAYLVESYQKCQDMYEGWKSLKRKVLSKDMTSAQALHYAKSVLGLSSENAEDVIEEFKVRKLIDDRAYALDKAEYWQSQGYSIRKISQKLAKAGIEPDLIEEAVGRLKNEKESANALSYARHIVSSVRQKSARLKRQTIVSRLIAQGYGTETAKEAAEALVFDEEEDLSALEDAWKKAGRLYASFDEEEKQYKMIHYCLKQGFSYSQVEDMMERTQLDD